MKQVNIGILGTGSMCKLHSAAYALFPLYFSPSSIQPVKKVLCDINPEFARAGAEKYGWENVVTDWRELVSRPDVDLVDICTPNNTHKEIAIEAAKNGKMIYCEKPLATSAKDAKEMYEAAKKYNVPTAVAFNKRRFPAVVYAKQLVEEGFIGKPLYFRGSFISSFALDPYAPRSWRFQKSVSGSGVLADLGSHAIDLCRYLIGEFDEVIGMSSILYNKRPLPGAMQGVFNTNFNETSPMGDVDVEDACVFIGKAENGALINFELTRISSGKNDGLSFELWGTKGGICWDQQHSMEIQISSECDPANKKGFKTIELGGAHPYGKVLWEVPGFGVGLSDVKSLEVHDFIEAAVNGKPFSANFYDGMKVCEIEEAVLKSIEERRWVRISEILEE